MPPPSPTGDSRVPCEGRIGTPTRFLIELMVVVLIIGILIAIALPTFLGARNKANDRAAQSSLRNALTTAKACFTDNDSYTGPPACDETARSEERRVGKECRCGWASS